MLTSIFDLQSNLASCFVHPAAKEYVCWNSSLRFAVESGHTSRKLDEL